MGSKTESKAKLFDLIMDARNTEQVLHHMAHGVNPHLTQNMLDLYAEKIVDLSIAANDLSYTPAATFTNLLMHEFICNAKGYLRSAQNRFNSRIINPELMV